MEIDSGLALAMVGGGLLCVPLFGWLPMLAKMQEFQEELAEAVETLDRRYSELKATAR